jgi:tRNA(fMet)-specific endonuclease VapC
VTDPAYMLDTNICIDITNGKVPEARTRLSHILPDDVAISAIVRAELLDGLMGLDPAHRLIAATHEFLAAIETLAWDGSFAEQFAMVRHRLRRHGNLIEDMDILIAAHAISIGATLVTRNIRHFERLAPDLKIENWVEPVDNSSNT